MMLHGAIVNTNTRAGHGMPCKQRRAGGPRQPSWKTACTSICTPPSRPGATWSRAARTEAGETCCIPPGDSIDWVWRTATWRTRCSLSSWAKTASYVKPFGAGHINDTYAVYHGGAGRRRAALCHPAHQHRVCSKSPARSDGKYFRRHGIPAPTASWRAAATRTGRR